MKRRGRESWKPESSRERLVVARMQGEMKRNIEINDFFLKNCKSVNIFKIVNKFNIIKMHHFWSNDTVKQKSSRTKDNQNNVPERTKQRKLKSNIYK